MSSDVDFYRPAVDTVCLAIRGEAVFCMSVAEWQLLWVGLVIVALVVAVAVVERRKR